MNELYIEFTISPNTSKQRCAARCPGCVGICVALPFMISGIEDGMWSMVETFRTQVVLLTHVVMPIARNYRFRRYSIVAVSYGL